jgi:hypothetical protein
VCACVCVCVRACILPSEFTTEIFLPGRVQTIQFSYRAGQSRRLAVARNTRDSQSSRIYLTSTVWCTMSANRPDRVLLVISTCKFCKGCVMQFGGSGVTSSRQGQRSLHHDNAPSHTSLVVQQFLSSPNHRALRTSLRVAFGCSLLWKWASRGHVSQPCKISYRIRRPNSRRFQKKPSAGAFNSGRIDECKCVRAQGSYVTVCLTITVQNHHSGNLLTAHCVSSMGKIKIRKKLLMQNITKSQHWGSEYTDGSSACRQTLHCTCLHRSWG